VLGQVDVARRDVRRNSLRRHWQRGMHTGSPGTVRADLQHARSIARPPAGQRSDTRRAPPSDSITVPVRFGVLWYRILATHGPLNAALARELTALLTV
jgi:hypothetical protein